MKIHVFVFAIVFAIVIAGPSAFAGGAPGAHDLSGADFGAAASESARSAPGAVGEHASGVHGGGKPDSNPGAPGAHDLSGADFGAAASESARSAPGAVGEHASGEHGGSR